jgi:RNA polymerase sigma-70 factor (ECF subfamily)
MALDRFAFAEIYRQWLHDLRAYGEPGVTQPDAARFAALFHGEGAEAFDPFTVRYLQHLPPQQRLTLLLVYGEGFDHIDAGRVLDVPSETIATRLLRISAHLADCLGTRAKVALSGNVEEPYFEAHYQEQAS